jgi:hypothetical protein
VTPLRKFAELFLREGIAFSQFPQPHNQHLACCGFWHPASVVVAKRCKHPRTDSVLGVLGLQRCANMLKLA